MQTRIEYWWLFLEQLELLYTLSVDKYHREIDSYFYNALNRISDFILGESHSVGHGVLYGYKMIPRDQNAQAYSSSGSFSYESAPNIENETDTQNYKIKCINKEYESMPFGPPTISYGSLFTSYYAQDSLGENNGTFSTPRIFDNGLETTENAVISEILPPSNLQEILITSSTYMIVYDTGTKYAPLPVTIFSQGTDGSPTYIGEHRINKLTLKTYDPSFHIKNVYNPSVFPEVPDGSIEIARTVWRIGTTMANEDAEYEYYIIDSRQPYGYYGWNQFECVSILKNLYNQLNPINRDLVDVIKGLWSVVFNEMEWGSTGFLNYWTSNGYTPTTTMIALYNELAI